MSPGATYSYSLVKSDKTWLWLKIIATIQTLGRLSLVQTGFYYFLCREYPPNIPRKRKGPVAAKIHGGLSIMALNGW
jgi:hypothetical protein